MSQKKSNTAGIVGGILGVAAAATAGAYFLYGTKEGKTARKQLRGWTLKAKGEVLEKLENLKEVNQDAYHNVVDAVLKKYEPLKNIDSKEIVRISKELKGHWKNIRKELEEGAKKVVAVKKTVQKKSAPTPKKA